MCSGASCSCAANGLSCTNYCVCEGNIACFNPQTLMDEDVEGQGEEDEQSDDDCSDRAIVDFEDGD